MQKSEPRSRLDFIVVGPIDHPAKRVTGKYLHALLTAFDFLGKLVCFGILLYSYNYVFPRNGHLVGYHTNINGGGYINYVIFFFIRYSIRILEVLSKDQVFRIVSILDRHRLVHTRNVCSCIHVVLWRRMRMYHITWTCAWDYFVCTHARYIISQAYPVILSYWEPHPWKMW